MSPYCIESVIFALTAIKNTMNITVNQKEFEPMIEYDQIKKRIRLLGVQISLDYENQHPVFVGVLNGCFMFMADLMKEVDLPCEVSFVKLSSYSAGTQRGELKELMGLAVDLKGRDVIIVEDIVDTGHSLKHTLDAISTHQPKSVTVCTLLLKPAAMQYDFDNIAYVGFEIGNEFVVGYGLDYNGLARNLKDIYREAPVQPFDGR